MTSTPALRPLAAADEIHFLRDGLIFRTSSGWAADSRISGRGQTVCLTDAILDANRQADGTSFFDLVDDEQAQIDRWGEVTIARGPAPEMNPWVYGSPSWSLAREGARKAAHAQLTPEERRDALTEVNRVYGPAPTSRTIKIEGPR